MNFLAANTVMFDITALSRDWLHLALQLKIGSTEDIHRNHLAPSNDSLKLLQILGFLIQPKQTLKIINKTEAVIMQ